MWRRINATREEPHLLVDVRASRAETLTSSGDPDILSLAIALRARSVLIHILRMRDVAHARAPLVGRHTKSGIVPVVVQRQDL